MFVCAVADVQQQVYPLPITGASRFLAIHANTDYKKEGQYLQTHLSKIHAKGVPDYHFQSGITSGLNEGRVIVDTLINLTNGGAWR